MTFLRQLLSASFIGAGSVHEESLANMMRGTEKKGDTHETLLVVLVFHSYLLLTTCLEVTNMHTSFYVFWEKLYKRQPKEHANSRLLSPTYAL